MLKKDNDNFIATFLFVDIPGFTVISENLSTLGKEDSEVTFIFLHFFGIDYDKNINKSREMLTRFYEILKSKAKKYDGWINRFDVYKVSERAIR